MLRIGVIGAGYMGSLHAEKLAFLQRNGAGVTLEAVADIKPARARSLGRRHGVDAFEDYRPLLSKVDAVVVAVPTVSHFEVVRDALLAGVDVLVEKPIAATLAEAEHLLMLVRRERRVLQVGHLEWFNSALQAVRHRIERPRFIEAHRMGPFPDRVIDIDVVRDLMIHDLDILQRLLGEEPRRIDAVGIPILTPNIDIANARLFYPGGCVATLTASRVSSVPTRTIRFFQNDGYVFLDLLGQSVTVVRPETGVNGLPARIEVEKLEVERSDALLGELEAFVRALHTRERPKVDGARGMGALRTALRVHAAIDAFNDDRR